MPGYNSLWPARISPEGTAEMEVDPLEEKVKELLDKYEFEPEPEKKERKYPKTRKVLGNISDLLTNYADRRAGRRAAPMGRIAAKNARLDLEHQRELEGVVARNRDARNRIRMGVYAGKGGKAWDDLSHKIPVASARVTYIKRGINPYEKVRDDPQYSDIADLYDRVIAAAPKDSEAKEDYLKTLDRLKADAMRTIRTAKSIFVNGKKIKLKDATTEEIDQAAMEMVETWMGSRKRALQEQFPPTFMGEPMNINDPKGLDVPRPYGAAPGAPPVDQAFPGAPSAIEVGATNQNFNDMTPGQRAEWTGRTSSALYAVAVKQGLSIKPGTASASGLASDPNLSAAAEWVYRQMHQMGP